MQNNSSNLNSSGNSSAQKGPHFNMSFDHTQSGRVIKSRIVNNRDNHHRPTASYFQPESGSASSKSSRSANSKKGASGRENSRSRIQGPELTYNILPASQIATLEGYQTINDNRQQVKTAFNSALQTCDVAFKVENVKDVFQLNFNTIYSALLQDTSLGLHCPQKKLHQEYDYSQYTPEATKRNIQQSMTNTQCHILEGLQIKNRQNNLILLEGIMSQFSSLKWNNHKRMNLFHWEIQDGYGPHKPRYTYGTQNSVKGASRQSFDAATLIYVIPKQESHHAGDPRDLLSLSIYDTESANKCASAVQSDHLINMLQRNGSGTRYLKGSCQQQMRNYKLKEGEIFLVPKGYSFQWQLHATAFVVQIPFYPITPELEDQISENKFSGNLKQHNPFNGSTFYRRMQTMAFELEAGDSFNCDEEANCTEAEQADYKRSMRTACGADHAAQMRKDIELNLREITKLRGGLQSKNEQKSLARMKNSEFTSYCEHCQSYIETIALVTIDGSNQSWYHIGCKKVKQASTYKFVFKDSVCYLDDIGNAVNLYHHGERKVKELPLVNPLNLFQTSSDATEFMGGVRGLTNTGVICGANAVAQLMSCCNELPQLQEDYKNAAQNNESTPLEDIYNHINGYQPDQRPSEWFDAFPQNLQGQETDVNDILERVIEKQIYNGIFRLQHSCSNCGESVTQPTITNKLRPLEEFDQPIAELCKLITQNSSGAPSTTSLVDVLLQRQILHTQPINCHNDQCNAQNVPTVVQTSMEALQEVRVNGGVVVPRNNVFFLNVLPVCLNLGSLTMTRQLCIGNTKYELRGLILQTTARGGHFATVGFQPGSHKPLLLRDDLQIEELPGIDSLHKSSEQPDGDKQWIPSVLMYQQYEGSTTGSKYVDYRNQRGINWKLKPQIDPILAQLDRKKQNEQDMEMYNIDNIDLPDPEYPTRNDLVEQAYRTGLKADGNGGTKPLDPQLGVIEFNQYETEENKAQALDTTINKICAMCNQTNNDLHNHRLVKCTTCRNNGSYYGTVCLVNIVRRSVSEQVPEYYCLVCNKNIFEHDTNVKHISNLFKEISAGQIDANQQYTGLVSLYLEVLRRSELELPHCQLVTPDRQIVRPVFHTALFRSYYHNLFDHAELDLSGFTLKLRRSPQIHVAANFPTCTRCKTVVQVESFVVQLQCKHWMCFQCLWNAFKMDRMLTPCGHQDCWFLINRPIVMNAPIVMIVPGPIQVGADQQVHHVHSENFLFADLYPMVKLMKHGIPETDFLEDAREAQNREEEEERAKRALFLLMHNLDMDASNAFMNECTRRGLANETFTFVERLEFAQQLFANQPIAQQN